ncbi:hypothetical protein [Streptomyces sp. I5]|nr:hypothetical protein [Streptomyces sp. I5]
MARADSASEAHSSGPPTLPEDLLLLLSNVISATVSVSARQ